MLLKPAPPAPQAPPGHMPKTAPAVVMTAPELSASAPAVKVKAPKEPKVRAPREKKEGKFDWKWGLGDVKLGGRWKTRKPKVQGEVKVKAPKVKEPKMKEPRVRSSGGFKFNLPKGKAKAPNASVNGPRLSMPGWKGGRAKGAVVVAADVKVKAPKLKEPKLKEPKVG